MKRELLLLLMKKQGLESESSELIPRRGGSNVYPLSFSQQRLWFLSQFDPDSSFDNVPVGVRLTGSLNVAALEQTINEVARRHEILRTVFSTVDGQPVQIVRPETTFDLPVVDLRRLTETRREDEVLGRAEAEARRPFDLSSGPLLRATLLRLRDDEYVLLLTMHHIISDGWSMGVLVREVATLYEVFAFGKPPTLRELTIQYGDFAVWQRQRLRQEVLDEQLAYWRATLAGASHVLNFPTDHVRPRAQSFQGATLYFRVPADLAAALRTLGEQQSATLFMTLLAAFQTLLYHYTASEDFLLGTAIANRNRAEIEPLIGFFVNTLVLRCDMTGNPRFMELLGRARDVTLGAYAHQDVPFEKLVEELQTRRDLSRSPLFQVMFILHNAPLPPMELQDLKLSPLTIDNGAARFDLELAMFEAGDEIDARLTYSTDLFDAATVAQLADYFQRLLREIAAHPERRVLDFAVAASPKPRHSAAFDDTDKFTFEP